MPSYHVERTIVIDKPLLDVRDTLKDFTLWPQWSPWIVMEPDASLTYSEKQGQVGASYGWAGVLIGAGSLELVCVQDDLLEMEITYVEPIKAKAEISFGLEEVEGGTEVTWMMDGSLPFLLYLKEYKTQTFMAMDYERGLLMLKSYLETGRVDSYTVIEGIVTLPEQRYIGIENSCTLDELGEVMKKDFETLYAFMGKEGISMDRIPFTIYHTFDVFERVSRYTACIPFEEKITLPQEWVKGKISPKKALKTIHKGAYLHLGNAWTTAMNFARYKKIKLEKSPVGYEFYPNNPYETAEKDLITEIYLPLR